MPQLTLNGITVPVLADGWKPEVATIGDETRSASGKMVKTVLRAYRKYSGRLASTSAEEAEALSCMIRGEGYGWSFDADLYADNKGLGYITSGTASVVGTDGGVSPKFGSKMLKMSGAASLLWTHGLAATAWSVAWWWWSGSAWAHRAIRSDTSGSYWANGVLTSGTPAYITATGSALTISQGVGGGTTYLDDVVYLPYLAPASWFATWAAASTAIAKPPLLAGGGTLLAYGGTTLRGNTAAVEVQNRGTLDHLQRIDFTLEED